MVRRHAKVLELEEDVRVAAAQLEFDVGTDLEDVARQNLRDLEAVLENARYVLRCTILLYNQVQVESLAQQLGGLSVQQQE